MSYKLRLSQLQPLLENQRMLREPKMMVMMVKQMPKMRNHSLVIGGDKYWLWLHVLFRVLLFVGSVIGVIMIQTKSFYFLSIHHNMIWILFMEGSVKIRRPLNFGTLFTQIHPLERCSKDSRNREKESKKILRKLGRER